MGFFNTTGNGIISNSLRDTKDVKYFHSYSAIKLWWHSGATGLASCSHLCASVTKQYNLVPAKGND